jgi:methionine biosynthesis protein MetW
VSTPNSASNSLRYDLSVIASWIEPGSRVLDLGCGEGTLLSLLRDSKQVIGIGIEKNEAKAITCIEKGLTVLQGDINTEVDDYNDNAFDYIILSQTLQQVYEPALLLQRLLRIGRRVIVSFPNFSHWRSRLHLLVKGRAPKTEHLPYEWHNTPNIRVITIDDFRRFVRQEGCVIKREEAINTHHHDTAGHRVRLFPNLMATYAIFLLEKKLKAESPRMNVC